MDLINKFMSDYATLLIYTALTAIVGVITKFVRKKYQEKCDTKTKKEVVKSCVLAVQQLYKDLDGETKKEKAVESISAMLAEKGISITPLEINILIEACIGEFKGVFNEEYTTVTEKGNIGFAVDEDEVTISDDAWVVPDEDENVVFVTN